MATGLRNQGDFYYGNTANLTGYFTARLDIPNGAIHQSTICYFRDHDVLLDGSAHILRVYEYDPPASPAPNWQPILSLGTSGASGYQRRVGNVPIQINHHGTDTAGNSFNQFYVLYVILPPLSVLPGLPILSSATFRGCEVRYTPPAS